MSLSPPLRKTTPSVIVQPLPTGWPFNLVHWEKLLPSKRFRSAVLQTVGGASASRSFFLLVCRNRKTGGVHPSAFPESFSDLYPVFAEDCFPDGPWKHRKFTGLVELVPVVLAHCWGFHFLCGTSSAPIPSGFLFATQLGEEALSVYLQVFGNIRMGCLHQSGEKVAEINQVILTCPSGMVPGQLAIRGTWVPASVINLFPPSPFFHSIPI